jgi:hypothetical protein
VSVTTEVGVENDGAPEDPVREGGSFLDPLVVRPPAEYGVDVPAIRRQGAERRASFAGARVQAFVPMLVEQRLRGTLRGWSGPGRTLATHEEFEAVTG